jgi:hypothetical protein
MAMQFPYFLSTSWLDFLSAISSYLHCWLVYTHSKSRLMWEPCSCLPSLWLFPSLQPKRVPQWTRPKCILLLQRAS